MPPASRPAKRARVERVRVFPPASRKRAAVEAASVSPTPKRVKFAAGVDRLAMLVAAADVVTPLAVGETVACTPSPAPVRRRRVTVVRAPVVQEVVVPISPSLLPATPAVVLPEAPRRPAAFDLLAALADAAASVAAADAAPKRVRIIQVPPIFLFPVDARASKAVAPPPPRGGGRVTRSKRGV